MKYMPKSTFGKWALGGLVLGLILLAIFWQDVKAFTTRSLMPPELPDEGSEAEATAMQTLDRSKILSKGSKGLEVRTLQKALIQDGGKLPKFGADGTFGNETEAALLAVSGSGSNVGVRKISLDEYYNGSWRQTASTGIIKEETALPAVNIQDVQAN